MKLRAVAVTLTTVALVFLSFIAPNAGEAAFMVLTAIAFAANAFDKVAPALRGILLGSMLGAAVVVLALYVSGALSVGRGESLLWVAVPMLYVYRDAAIAVLRRKPPVPNAPEAT